MRTDAEKQAFVMECLRIEKQGGNVQEYIAQNWPSYTPRATWYNLQKQYLGRNVNQLTEGKPKIERKEVNTMRKRRDMNVVLDEILKVIEAHGDPIAWFEKEGYAFPFSGWSNLKKWAQTTRPDDFKKLPKDMKLYYAKHGIQRHGKASDAAKPGDNTTEGDKAPETVVMNGKEYEKMDGIHAYPGLPGAAEKDIYGRHPVTAYVEKPSPTCCQPAKQSGPIEWDDNGDMSGAPDEIVMEKLRIQEGTFVVEDGHGNKCKFTDELDAWDGMRRYKVYPIGHDVPIDFTTTQISSKHGTWGYSEEFKQYTFIPNDGLAGFLRLSIADWLNLAAEIPEAIKILAYK